MPTPSIAATAPASAFALISLGGGIYEFRVVDPAWPCRPELIQSARGVSPSSRNSVLLS
jgi:hypothetical protein